MLRLHVHVAIFRAVQALAVVGAVACLACAGAGATGATPTPFNLVYDGSHIAATIASPSGLEHVGTFTSSAPIKSVPRNIVSARRSGKPAAARSVA